MPSRYLKPRNVKEFDKEWIDEINRCLAERDEVIDRIMAEHVIFAWSFCSTNGVGGITVFSQYGCSTRIAGTTIRMVFHQRRPDIEYVAGGTYVGGAPRFVTIPGRGDPSQLETHVDIRFYANAGPVSASTNAFTAMLWAMGPRVLT